MENMYGTRLHDMLYADDVEGKKFLASSDAVELVEQYPFFVCSYVNFQTSWKRLAALGTCTYTLEPK